VGGRLWTEKEDNFLRSNWETKTAQEIASVLKRSVVGVYARAKKLGLKRKTAYFTPEEDEFIITHYQHLTGRQIAEKLGRSPNSIHSRALRLGVATKGNTPSFKGKSAPVWTPEEEEFLRRHWPIWKASEIAKALGKSPSAVYSKAERMGLELNGRAWRYHRNLLDGSPYENLSEVERAYIAGIIDGEGCIGRHSGPKNRAWRISISNTCRHLIDWLIQRMPHATIREITYTNSRYKTRWDVLISGDLPVYFLLRAVLPYLIVKRSRAEEAIREIEERYPEVKEIAGRDS